MLYFGRPRVFETEIYFTDSWRATRARRRFSFVGRSRGGPFICGAAVGRGRARWMEYLSRGGGSRIRFVWRGGGSRMGPLDGVFESRRWVADLFRVARRLLYLFVARLWFADGPAGWSI